MEERQRTPETNYSVGTNRRKGNFEMKGKGTLVKDCLIKMYYRVES